MTEHPSADRPLPLPEELFTEDDVALVDGILDDWFLSFTLDVWPNFEPAARLVLEALANAGRLLPASAEHREEWTYAETDPETGLLRPVHWDHLFDSRGEVESHVAFFRQQFPGPSWVGVRVARREVATWESEWVEVDPAEKIAEEEVR